MCIRERPKNIREVFFSKNSQARGNLNLIFASVYTLTHAQFHSY